jgi:hypothetical protein
VLVMTISENLTKNVTLGAVGTFFGGTLLLSAGLGFAGAEPLPAPPGPPAPDGLVSIIQGETVVADSVPTAEAAAVVAQLCAAAAPDPLGLAGQVDVHGATQVACAGLPAGDVVVIQNGMAAPSPVFPGQGPAQGNVDPAQQPAADVPPGSAEAGQDSQVPNPTADPDFGIDGDQSVDEDQDLTVDEEQ